MIQVTNIAKDKVGSIPMDAPLISISDKYSYGAAIPNEKNRPLLKLDFFPGDHIDFDNRDHCMRPELAKKIFDFMAKRKDGEVVYIQCGEGRFRSYTLCTMLEHLLYPRVRHNRELATVKQGNEDRYTARELVKYYERHIDDGEDS